MTIFELEKMIIESKEDFIKLIINTDQDNGLDMALKLIKKSGLCINEFGNGKPKDNKLYRTLINELRLKHPNDEALDKFEKEVKIINNLFMNISKSLEQGAETKIHSGLQVISYLIALEIFLTNCSNNQFLERLKIKNTGLKNVSVNVHENIVDSTGLVMNYFLYKNFSFANISSKISEQEFLYASQHINLSSLRLVVKTIEELWNYFDLNISSLDEYFEFKALGNHALAATISKQIFFDIRNAKMSRYAYQNVYFKKNYKLVNKLPPYHYISSDEEMACEFIDKYFSIKDIQEEFNGVSLAELIRAYSIISREAELF